MRTNDPTTDHIPTRYFNPTPARPVISFRCIWGGYSCHTCSPACQHYYHEIENDRRHQVDGELQQPPTGGTA